MKNGEGETLDPSVGYELNFKNLIEPNNADVFIHSWSTEHSEFLKSTYRPVSATVEPQRTFKESKRLNRNRDLAEKLKLGFDYFVNRKSFDALRVHWEKEAFRAQSRWFSTQETLRLKSEWESKMGFDYDCVIVTRLDVAFYTPLNLKEFDMDFLHVSNWNHAPPSNVSATEVESLDTSNQHQNRGFLDFWFFSSSRNMDSFGGLFKEIDKYHPNPHRSSFQHSKRIGLRPHYTLYRWQDHEMLRRKEFRAES